MYLLEGPSLENSKSRRREAAIAEGKKPLTTMGFGERFKVPIAVGVFRLSNILPTVYSTIVIILSKKEIISKTLVTASAFERMTTDSTKRRRKRLWSLRRVNKD